MAEHQHPFPTKGAEGRLKEFDLTVPEVHEHVIRRGLDAFGGVSPLAPPGAAAHAFHVACVVGVRELLCVRGWETAEGDLVPRTVNPKRHLAIIVAPGNEFTAQPDSPHYLTTAWPRGPRTLAWARVHRPVGLEAVDDSGFNWGSDSREDPKWKLWCLLHHRTETEVRLELSAPTHQDKRGRLRGWTNLDRIILPPFVLRQVSRDEDQANDTGGEPDVPEPDVPVIPR